MIKSTAKSNKPPIRYPMLKINSSKKIVLFTDKKTGTVIHSNGGFYTVGYYRKNWNEIAFLNYTGSITLKNTEE
jgi:hypothetical protein